MARNAFLAGACVLLFLSGDPSAAAAQARTGVTLGSDAVELTIGGRVQTQFNTTTVLTEAPSELILRRARLEIEVKLNDLVSGAIEPEFAGDEVTLKDAFMQLNFSPAFQVLAGNAYKPFSLIETTSSTRILPIERGARIRGFNGVDHYAIINDLDYSDRDIGLQVMGAPDFIPLGFTYQAGVFRGPLHGASTVKDSYQYAGRITVQPHEVVRVGGAWSSRQFIDIPPNESDPFVRGHAFEVDVEVGAFTPGLHLMGEVAFGDADAAEGTSFFGTQGWLAWRSERLSPVISAIEPMVRASYGDRDEGITTTLLTPGINVYFGGRNRFMLNYDFALVDSELPDAGNEGSFKAQLQMAF